MRVRRRRTFCRYLAGRTPLTHWAHPVLEHMSPRTNVARRGRRKNQWELRGVSEMFLQVAVTVSPVVRGQSNPEVFLEPKRAGQVTFGWIGRLTIAFGIGKSSEGQQQSQWAGQPIEGRPGQRQSQKKNNDSKRTLNEIWLTCHLTGHVHTPSAGGMTGRGMESPPQIGRFRRYQTDLGEDGELNLATKAGKRFGMKLSH